MTHFRKVIGSLRQHWDVVLLVLTFLIASIGRSSLSVFLQYVSKRYGWILANVSTHPFLVLVVFQKTDFELAPQANYLISFRAVTSLILLVVVLPMISTMLVDRFGLDAAWKDLAIARTRIILMASGFFIIAVSPIAAKMIMNKHRSTNLSLNSSTDPRRFIDLHARHRLQRLHSQRRDANGHA